MRIGRSSNLAAGLAFVLLGNLYSAIRTQLFAQIGAEKDLPPAPVSRLIASNGDPLILTWELPQDRDLAGVVIRHAAGQFPNTVQTGMMIADLPAPRTHIDVPAAAALPVDHHFSVYTYDRDRLFSPAGHLRVYCDLDGCITVPDPDTLNSIHDPDQAEALRRRILAELWEGGNLPAWFPDAVSAIEDGRYPQASRIETLRIDMESGLFSTAWFMTPQEPAGRLMIYHAGHETDFHQSADVLQRLLEESCHVLALNMPLTGDNLPTGSDLSSHDDLESLARPMHFFAEPVIVSLNYALQAGAFRHVAMMGLSGGGWTTTLAAAIDPRIDAAYSVAGGYPSYIRDQIPGNKGDFEQRNEAFWGQVSDLEMYILAGANARYIQFFNYHDPCCSQNSYALTYENAVADIVRSLGGVFGVVIDYNQREHAISGFVLDTIFTLEDAP